LGFRPDVKVDTFSPAYALQKALAELQARVTLEDPLYADAELEQKGFEPSRIAEGNVEAVVLNTAHSAFAKPDFAAWRAAGVEVVLDGQRLWVPHEVEAADILYLGVGRDASRSREQAAP